MKMLTAIVNKEDTGSVCRALTENGISFTKLATTGGFLMSGNTTLLIGVEDDKVDHVIDCIRDKCCRRSEIVPATASYGMAMANSYPLEVTVGGAIIFVTDVVRFEKL